MPILVMNILVVFGMITIVAVSSIVVVGFGLHLYQDGEYRRRAKRHQLRRIGIIG